MSMIYNPTAYYAAVDARIANRQNAKYQAVCRQNAANDLSDVYARVMDRANDLADEYATQSETILADAAADLLDAYANRPVEAAQGPGAFRVNGTIVRVKLTRGTKRPYAMLRDASGEFVYVRGAISSVSEADRLTYADALALSEQFNQCIVCGRCLTAAKSVAQGMGPICISRTVGYPVKAKRARKVPVAV